MDIPLIARFALLSLLPTISPMGGVSTAAAQCGSVELRPWPDPTVEVNFGHAVAAEGDRVLVGAPSDRTALGQTGSATLFQWNGSVWVPEARLLAAEGGTSDQFGWSVAIDGSACVVGAISRNQGTVYMFRFDGAAWSEEQSFSGSLSLKSYGRSVAIEGDRILVGVPGATSQGGSTGAVDYYEYRSGTWSRRQRIVASDAAAADSFGFDVALDGDRAVVGARGHLDAGTTTGAVYVFTFDGTAWVEEQKLVASDAQSLMQLGYSVDLEGDVIVAGAPEDGSAAVDAGAVYVFRHDGLFWQEEAKRTASDASASDHFGYSVALDGDAFIVGARFAAVSRSHSGAAYVFRRMGGVWSEESKLTAKIPYASQGFGREVDAWQGRVLVGAPYVRRNSAYVKGLPTFSLEAEPTVAPPGNDVLLTAKHGAPLQPILLVNTQVNDVRDYLPLLLGTFDAQGQWTIAGTVPPGTSGTELFLQAIGFLPCGAIDGSNWEGLTIP